MHNSIFVLTSPISPLFSSLTCPSLEESFDMVSSRIADAPASLKRTFTLVSQSPSDLQDSTNPFKTPALSSSKNSPRRMSLSLKRRYPFCKPPSSPVPCATPLVPSFVSIFDPDADMSGCSLTKDTNNKSHHKTAAVPVMNTGSTGALSLQQRLRQENGSGNTSASSSTNSSPTTTISTVESVNIEQISPESSPDSPVSIMPLSCYKSSNIGNPSSEEEEDLLSTTPPSPRSGCTRSASPSKKPRNTKNLSLNMASNSPLTCSSDDMTQSPRSISAPPSPAFIVPPPPPQNPRRRPSNLGLTIKLPGSLPEKSAVRGPPPAIGGISALRHHQSSPSLFSPAHGGVPGGMRLPPQSASYKQPKFFHPPRPTFTNTFNAAQESLSSSLSSSSISNSPPKTPEPLPDMEEEEEPRSGEAKPPAYPQGPICIFDPNIYLFSEPDAELASQFDVVINVAREVLNPFKVVAAKQQGERGSAASIGAAISSSSSSRPRFSDSPPPDTACTDASFTTAFEEAMFSPMMRKVETPKARYREPEYIHMPWDHNTPILDDLPDLVNLIDERSKAGKKVLVHCQCGVSRSATLLIAYAMFKNPDKHMQDGYAAVKARSKWIGPNMSLIYQLADWKKKISSNTSQSGTGGVGGVRGLMKGGKGFGRSRGNTTPGTLGIPDSPPEPQTAPLPQRRSSPIPSNVESSAPAPKEHSIPQMIRTRSENGGFLSDVSPGPSSAPPGMMTIPSRPNDRQSWPDGDAKFEPQSTRPSPPPSWAAAVKDRDRDMSYANPPPPLPPSAAYLVEPSSERISERAAEREIFGRDSNVDDDTVPPTPSFTSPRNSGYFGMPIRRPTGFGNLFSDPRSPTQRGTETPIVRSIFDVL